MPYAGFWRRKQRVLPRYNFVWRVFKPSFFVLRRFIPGRKQGCPLNLHALMPHSKRRRDARECYLVLSDNFIMLNVGRWNEKQPSWGTHRMQEISICCINTANDTNAHTSQAALMALLICYCHVGSLPALSRCTALISEVTLSFTSTRYSCFNNGRQHGHSNLTRPHVLTPIARFLSTSRW